MESFINALRSMFGCSLDITPESFISFCEAALFFGVDYLLSECQCWLKSVTSYKGILLPQIQLADLISIWKYGLENAIDFVPQLCIFYLACNFMWAISFDAFHDVPYEMLYSCIKNPNLTVDSEKHLCDAILAWLTSNTKEYGASSASINDYTDILAEIRFGLLPLSFAAVKRRCNFFSEFADRGISTILTLASYPSASSTNILDDEDFSHLRIRLTKYTKKVDLSGCPQFSPALLLLSVLHSSHSMDPILKNKIKQQLLTFEDPIGPNFEISWQIFPILTFEGVQEVDISNCQMPLLKPVVECFSRSFPSLKTLKAANYLKLPTAMLYQLVQRCRLLNDVDLSVDISPIIPAKVSIKFSHPDVAPQRSRRITPMDAVSFSYNLGLQLSNITNLTLEGRTDISDRHLFFFTEFCPSLCYVNLRGCISLTDDGISVVLLKCIKLHSILVCDTYFGRNSVLALCYGASKFENSAAPKFEDFSQSLASRLQVLHMGGCKSVTETFLSELISQTPMLKSLCLRETELVDHALDKFSGSCLEMLDVSNTKVSGSAVAQVIRRNLGLKCFIARDCRNFLQEESKSVTEKSNAFSYHYSELYYELGKSCQLEEIAVGWGFSFFSLEVLRPAIRMLRTIIIGLGGSFGEDGLKMLPTLCPWLETLILYFQQVISDSIMLKILKALKNLQVLALCYCIGEISSSIFKFSMPNLRKLKLERVTAWMTNDDLLILTQNCVNLIELSLAGCSLLNSESQHIISLGWPGLISVHLEDCGEVTSCGVTSLLECHALEDIILRHNGTGMQRDIISHIASKMPMLRKISLDVCDAMDRDFDIPNFTNRYPLSIVKIARCKQKKCSLELMDTKYEGRTNPVHVETLVMVWNSKELTTAVVKERL
ncbi:BTB/POZ domain-containing protein FBL11 isoform X1 [Ipomoea triloba]|uniref:BTB/POZ domain-containing protein FBL11 isoform X1 n=1 Tax=Ipomoea triloba TaxID=35885 RepID=UPI00125DE1DD|nr:BTB/POZ domain-containing protein FBL11 isoform X1 [Ipomoea triloba]